MSASLETDDIRYHTEVGTGYSAAAQLCRAADEIDRLRAEITAEKPNPAVGVLRIMGQIDVAEPDEGIQTYPMALLIEFDSREAIRKALTDGRCDFVFPAQEGN